jgi:hypothetical protein
MEVTMLRIVAKRRAARNRPGSDLDDAGHDVMGRPPRGGDEHRGSSILRRSGRKEVAMRSPGDRLVLAAVLAASVLVLLAAHDALAQGVRVGLFSARYPEFFSCTQAIPFPPTTPPGARQFMEGRQQNDCGGGPVSGKVLVLEISDRAGRVPPGLHAVQTIQVEGSRWLPDPATGQCTRKMKYAYVLAEFFENPAGQPALDHHIAVECCELRFVENVTAETAILPRPPGARPLAGFGAGYAYTTPDEHDAIWDKVHDNAGARFGYRYVHDTCHRPPRTPSGTVHWMRYQLEYPGGPSGSTVVTGN